MEVVVFIIVSSSEGCPVSLGVIDVWLLIHKMTSP